MPVSPELARLRSRVAVLTRYQPDHDALIEARRDLKAEKVAQWLQRTLAAAPPLTDEQRDRLAELLRPARKASAA